MTIEQGLCFADLMVWGVDAQKVQPKGKVGRADLALSLIRSLYAVEQRAKTMTAEKRLALRESQSRPLIEKLTVFPTDGRIPLQFEQRLQ